MFLVPVHALLCSPFEVLSLCPLTCHNHAVVPRARAYLTSSHVKFVFLLLGRTPTPSYVHVAFTCGSDVSAWKTLRFPKGETGQTPHQHRLLTESTPTPTTPKPLANTSKNSFDRWQKVTNTTNTRPQQHSSITQVSNCDSRSSPRVSSLYTYFFKIYHTREPSTVIVSSKTATPNLISLHSPLARGGTLIVIRHGSTK